jgi:hypothetical protein
MCGLWLLAVLSCWILSDHLWKANVLEGISLYEMGKLWTISTLGDECRRFEDTFRLRLRDRTTRLSSHIAKQRGFSETLVTLEHRTRRHVPEDNKPFVHRDENLKSHTIEVYFVFTISINRLGRERINLHVIIFLTFTIIHQKRK